MSDPEELRKRLGRLNREPLGEREGVASSGERPGEDLRRRLRKGLRSRRKAAGAGSSGPAGGARHEGPAVAAGPGPHDVARAPGEMAAKPGLEPIVYRRDVPHRPAPPALPAALRSLGPHVPLQQAVPGVEATAPDGSRAYRVDRPLHGPGSPWAPLSLAVERALADGASGLRAELDRLDPSGALGPEDLMLLDLETAGLGCCPLFLVGAMVWEPPGLVVRQFLARDYSEERAALSLFLALAQGRRLLVSFNGKSFDLPFVRARAAASGLACRLDALHLDLLHVARRTWGDGLPDCRLQTLEHRLCGRLRADDIPGHLIPDVYHEFVRTGNAARMATVLEHNFLDLVTLVDVLTRVPPP